MNNKVSIGMPVFNGENYIEQALTSILNQSYEDFELIISDNHSTDSTEEICRNYANNDKRIKYFRNKENIGAARNYNRVFELAKGQYFKWASHDDIIAPTYLEKCVEVMDHEYQVVLCFPAICYIDENDTILYQQQGDLSCVENRINKRLHQLISHQLKNNDIYWSVFGLIRRDILSCTDLIASYNASDQVLLLQLLLQGKFYQLPENLYFRREHPKASMTQFKSEQERLKWFDPNIKKKIIFPHWNLFYKYLQSVQQSSIGSYAKLCCYFEVIRRFTFEWRTLAGEFKIVLKQKSR